MVRSLVTYPDEVRVLCERKSEHVHVMICDQAQTDQPKLVGQKQETIWAIRCLLQSCGAKHGERVEVQLLEAIKDMPSITVHNDPYWNQQKSSALALLTSDIFEYALRDFTGSVAAHDNGLATQIIVKSPDLTPILATAVGRIVKAAGRMRGRRIEFKATKVE